MDCLVTGSVVDLDFPGFVRCRLSPGFSRVGVDLGLLGEPYFPLNLLGRGTRSEKVASTTRLCGGTMHRPGRRQYVYGLSRTIAGELGHQFSCPLIRPG